MAAKKFLVSDIGGTNIRLAWFNGDPRERQDELIFKIDPQTNKPYEIIPTLKAYCTQVNQHFDAACLGMAGLVEGDHVQITNRPDRVYRGDVAAVLGIEPERVVLVNDMPPHLAGVDLLLPSELIEILPGQVDHNGSRAVLMPGTGVGVGGAVTTPGSVHRPFPSEGGHVDFAPRNDQQDCLLKFLRPFALQLNQNQVSNEFVFAGEGLRRIYAFLHDPQARSFEGIPKSEEITTAAASGNLPIGDLRHRTVELYLKILAQLQEISH